MKILYLAPHPFFVERGTPIAVRQAVTTLCAAGHDVDLVTYHEGQDLRLPKLKLIRIATPPGVRDVPIGFSVKKLICDLWLAIAAWRLLLRHRYDVVHAGEEAVFIALVARPFRRFALFYDMDSILSDQIGEKWPKARPIVTLLRALENVAIRRSDRVIAVCPAIVDHAASVTDAGKVHLLPDVAFDPPAELPDVDDVRVLTGADGPLLLYVGNLEAYQGVAMMVRAMAITRARVDQPGHLVVIGGDAEAVADHAALAAELGIADHVHFLGPRPLAHLSAYLAQADILCSPRVKGVNTPMKIYSYMASTRPILATRIASHTQVLDARCAILAEPTADALAQGLIALLSDPVHAMSLGQAAARRATTEYSEASFNRRLLAIYGSAVV